MSRTIQPHKGGRDQWLPAGRVTKAELALIQQARGDRSFADFVVTQAQEHVMRDIRYFSDLTPNSDELALAEVLYRDNTVEELEAEWSGEEIADFMESYNLERWQVEMAVRVAINELRRK